jgi:ribonuclease HII
MKDYNPAGYDFVCGSDEAGYGAWAGPLVVAAVLAPVNWKPPPGLTDSKQLTESQREALFTILKSDQNIKYKIRSIPSKRIDLFGVGNELRFQHEELHQSFDSDIGSLWATLFIADGNLKLGDGLISPSGAPFEIRSIPKADTFVPAVSAASIFAKVTRDRAMVKLSKLYPVYGFENHRGYGVPAHKAALQKFGPCEIHRQSYSPIAMLRKPEPTPDIFADMEEADSG